jgi:mannose-6-phosphate isomerase
MDLLDSPIRHYAWGSRTSIAAIAGRPTPTERPEAELWMGAHPDSPSTVRRNGRPVPVGDVVAADPAGLLGPVVVERFGPRLPFMLKMLAADSSLSLQAHPDADTAARRYADRATTAAGERLYTDPYPKPELLVALDEFDALCGFRAPAESAAIMAALGVPALDQIVSRLRQGTVAAGLRGAVEMLLRWPVAQRTDLVGAVARAAAGRDDLDYLDELRTAFPDDPGVVVTLLLNHVRLRPDEAIWMPAGNMHAYLRGTGMEVLGASDNVLRGGLTAKPVDTDELLRVLRFEVLEEPVRKPVVLRPGLFTWPVPVPEFAMYRIVTDDPAEPVELAVPGPRIVFCVDGELAVDDGEAAVTLPAGAAAFGAAGRPLVISGSGTAFVATAG